MISKPGVHEYNPYLCENFHKPKLFTAIALVVPLMAVDTEQADLQKNSIITQVQ